jgi:hypothetical protein
MIHHATFVSPLSSVEKNLKHDNGKRVEAETGVGTHTIGARETFDPALRLSAVEREQRATTLRIYADSHRFGVANNGAARVAKNSQRREEITHHKQHKLRRKRGKM